MTFKGEEFKFPDENIDEEMEVIVEGDDEDVEIEVVDDTPEKDKGRKPADPPEEVTDEELESYSEKVKNRIKKFSRGYHDERRAKESAVREREEAMRLAQAVIAENNNLKKQYNQNQETLGVQTQLLLAEEAKKAKLKLQTAYESGDVEGIANAQEEIADVRYKLRKLEDRKEKPLQEVEVPVYSNQTPQVAKDERAEVWRSENQWFGQDDEMTSFALGLHQKLVKEGVDPTSDKYYDRINSRMRQVFPDQFDEQDVGTKPEVVRRKTAVASATRSTAPKVVRLTKTQAAIAKRLGLTPLQYAKEAALIERNTNG